MSILIELDKQIANLHEQLVKLVDEHEQLERGSDACATNSAELGAVIKVLVKRLKARTTITGKFQKWWFTFGLCHELYPNGCYTVLEGTYEEARQQMVEHYGSVWAFQYENAEAAGVETWQLKEVIRGSVVQS